jgi:hypothetical protein
MYIAIYIKILIIGDTHDEIMSDISVKKMSPLSHAIWLIHKLERYLDAINGDSLCLFNTTVAIPLYGNNVVILSNFRASLRRLLNELYGLCTSSSLEVHSSIIKNHDFWLQHKEIKPKAFCLDKGLIEITHKYIGIHLVEGEESQV